MIGKASFYLKTVNSINSDKDVRISDRLNIPSSKLRGFESGKVGPIDNGDYVGGNYVTTLNISNEIPVFDNLDNMSFSTFYDAAIETCLSRVWGGIHPPVDDIEGRKTGVKVAKSAIKFSESFFN